MSDHVKSRPSNIDAEAPWRAKLGPEVGAASKTDRMQKLVDQGSAPSGCIDIHCAITLHLLIQLGNVIVLSYDNLQLCYAMRALESPRQPESFDQHPVANAIRDQRR
jgi:hypothetical protein